MKSAFLKYTLWLTGVLFSLLALLAVVMWTPDTLRTDMLDKYTNEHSQFTPGGELPPIHFRDQGNRAGPVLVLIHGTSASLHTWEPLIGLLGDQFRMVTLDLPGHGLTGVTQQRDYSHPVMISAVLKVMDHLDIQQATLVGNSLGGNIAWRAALSVPPRVNALVLLAPSGAPRRVRSDSNLGFRILSNPLGRMLAQKISPRFVIEKSLRQTVHDDSMVNDAEVDRYWELLRLTGNRQAMIDLAQVNRSPDVWRQMDRIQQPTLIIWGKEDGLLPVSMLDTFAERLPTLTSHVYDGIGHLPMEEAPQRVALDISQFFRAHPAVSKQ